MAARPAAGMVAEAIGMERAACERSVRRGERRAVAGGRPLSPCTLALARSDRPCREALLEKVLDTLPRYIYIPDLQ